MADDIKITTGQGTGPSSSSPTPEFTPAQAPAPLAGQPDFLAPEQMAPSPVPEGVERNGGALRTILLILVGLIFVGGIGALGYFVIYPLLFPANTPVTQQPPVNTPAAAAHASFLTQTPAAVSEVRLSDMSYPAIASALQNEAFNQLADGQYKEVKISDAKGSQIPFSHYMGGISPAAKALPLGDWFENDFTALFYYDANGVWPMYVAKMKAGVSPAQVMAAMKNAEGSLELANFYLATPGTFSGFKDGKAGNYATRYNLATAPGAAFNYGAAGNYLLISTSYNGLKNALPALGL